MTTDNMYKIFTNNLFRYVEWFSTKCDNMDEEAVLERDRKFALTTTCIHNINDIWNMVKLIEREFPWINDKEKTIMIGANEDRIKEIRELIKNVSFKETENKYNTPCPHGMKYESKIIKVGSYGCKECKYWCGVEEVKVEHGNNDGIPITDYETVVRCSFMVDDEE